MELLHVAQSHLIDMKLYVYEMRYVINEITEMYHNNWCDKLYYMIWYIRYNIIVLKWML